ncbi:MAG: hypothetical protein WBA10_12155 [Elainellaceae cyanobacterium]
MLHTVLLSTPAIAETPTAGTRYAAVVPEPSLTVPNNAADLDDAVILEHRGSGRCTIDACSDNP